MSNPARVAASLCCCLAMVTPTLTAATPPATDTLTEHSATNWDADAFGASAAVFDDNTRVQTGNWSIRFETDGGFDTWLWTPAERNADWNLAAAGSGGVAFWVYAENDYPFQNNSPWVRLGTTDTDYVELRPDYDLLNEALGQWRYVTVPLNGDATWIRTEVGNPDLEHVNYVEFHADTWDAGFTLWFDGLTFDVPLSPPQGLLAVAGNGQVTLEWLPFSDPYGQFDHYAVYRATVPFTDVSGMSPIATLPDLATTSYVDVSAFNGVGYYYAVTAVFGSGAETTQVTAVGPRVPRDETDLQVMCISRTPRYPRYWPSYTYYQVVEPSGYGPYIFSAATGLLGGQDASTQRWPNVGDPVTYTARIRNRGTNTWSGTLGGTWRVDGEVAATPTQSVSLAPGDVTTFAFVLDWDDAWHEVRFTLDVTDARPENNERTVFTKSAPFLTYVDLGFVEDFRDRTSPQYPLAVTDDIIDWLQRHADRMNEMFAEQGGQKRIHYDVLEVIHDHDPDPEIDTIYFGVFPFRYVGDSGADPRSPGYYRPDEDLDYGLCHEMSHQLGLIDLYRLNVSAGQNLVSGLPYAAPAGLMNGVSNFYSLHSVLAMDHWADIVHGYYGQYLYCIPGQIRLRLLDIDGRPLSGATVLMYQKAERPGQGEVIADQVKAQGVTDENGEWILPNVPIDPAMVPPTYAGDELHANPFGYVAVVGTNGLLHFKVQYGDFVDYCWLDITEANVAYWQGQTDVAVFERQLAIGGDIQHYPPPDLAERNADEWYAWAQDGTLTLSDDSDHKVAGEASLKGVATGGFDNLVRYPYGRLAEWDLSNVQTIRFWAYAENDNWPQFQNNSPWVRLGNFQDGYFEWKPSWDILNLALNQWYEYVIPIEGDGTWTRTVDGTPTLAEINYFELHADTWGAGFNLWLDGVRFDPPPIVVGDVNCDGAVNAFDIDAFILALTDPGAYATTYPDCDPGTADVNQDGALNAFDIDPFIGLLTGTP